MRKLTLVILSILLMAFYSGCSMDSITNPKMVKPKIDPSLESVNKADIKFISDISTVAFEWKRASSPRVKGYTIYRADLNAEDKQLKEVAKIENVYTTHYVDTKLNPKTRYIYRITTFNHEDIEGVPSKDVEVYTNDRPEAVSFIQAISNLPKTAKVIWRPHQSERIKGYKLLKNDTKDNKWEELTTITGRLNAEYLDKDLKDGRQYQYKVIAYTFDNIDAYTSQVTSCVTKPLPNTIELYSATQDRPKEIYITWSPTNINDLVTYRVYRASSVSGDYEVIGKSLNTEFKDIIKEDGATYFYKVTAVDKDGLESLQQRAPITGATLPAPRKPVMSSVTLNNGKIIVSWTQTDPKTQSYIVTKKIKESWISSKKVNLKDITNTSFVDTDVRAGIEYEYSVRSVDANGLMSEETEPMAIAIPQKGQK